MNPIITLTTDFGYNDWFVGAMKGVIVGRNGNARLVDITHGLPEGNIAAGAFALSACSSYFPDGTMHVAVVDPGVGGRRKAIAIRTARHTFIGPDNGLLSLAVKAEPVMEVRHLQNERYFVQPVSRTFHGRDIFASVAGHLSLGADFSDLGPALDDFVHLDWPQPLRKDDSIRGQVIYIDRYGNGITNIVADTHGSPSGTVSARGHSLGGLAGCYEDAREGEPVALIGSCGLLEIAVNKGSAAEMLQLQSGDKVEWRFNA